MNLEQVVGLLAGPAGGIAVLWYMNRLLREQLKTERDERVLLQTKLLDFLPLNTKAQQENTAALQLLTATITGKNGTPNAPKG